MPYPIERKLVIAVSSRAVFNLEEANEVFEKQGIEAYRQHQRERINDVLGEGVAFRSPALCAAERATEALRRWKSLRGS